MNSHLLTGYWVECDNMTEGVDGALQAEPRASVLKVTNDMAADDVLKNRGRISVRHDIFGQLTSFEGRDVSAPFL